MTAARAFHGVQATQHAIARIAAGLEVNRVKDLDKARRVLARLWERLERLDNIMEKV